MGWIDRRKAGQSESGAQMHNHNSRWIERMNERGIAVDGGRGDARRAGLRRRVRVLGCKPRAGRSGVGWRG